jgi:hypothetical protein
MMKIIQIASAIAADPLAGDLMRELVGLARCVMPVAARAKAVVTGRSTV